MSEANCPQPTGSLSFGGADDIECYECAGCAGEVPVVEAVWLLTEDEARALPRDVTRRQSIEHAKPYCSVECFDFNRLGIRRANIQAQPPKVG